MDDVTWGALTACLTLVGAIYTWQAFKRRGAAAGTRGLALTLLPPAAWLTGTLEMFTEIAASVADWAKSLVFDPFVWAGVALAGLAVLLWIVGGQLHGRNQKIAKGGSSKKSATNQAAPSASSASSLNAGKPASSAPSADFDDIEELLKKRGIE